MLKIKLSIMADENKNSEILSVDNLLQKKTKYTILSATI